MQKEPSFINNDVNRNLDSINVLLESEKKYIWNIEFLISKFYYPLKELTKKQGIFSTPLLTEIDHDNIFINILLILEFNKKLCNELTKEIDKWLQTHVCIGKMLLNLSPSFKLYHEYVKKYNNSIKTLNKCKEKKAFLEWIKLQDIEIIDNQCFESLLIMPTLRISQYVLLFTDIIKDTDDNHVDYNDLCKCLDILHNMDEKLNKKSIETDNIKTINNIQVKIKDLPINISHLLRVFIHSGELIRCSCNNFKEKRLFYLFNDMLIATIPLDFNYSFFDGYILLRGSSLIESSNENDISIKYKNGKIITYTALTKESKDEWYMLFKSTIIKINASIVTNSSDYLLTNEYYAEGTGIKAGIVNIHKLANKKPIIVPIYIELRYNHILYIKKDEASLDYLHIIQLDNCIIQNNSMIYSEGFSFDIQDLKNTHTFIFPNEKEKNEWLHIFNSTMADLNSPITDICVIQMDKGDTIPIGYTPILQSCCGHSGNTNGTGGGREIYICYKKGEKDSKNNPKHPITDISIIYTDTGSLLTRKTAEDISNYHDWNIIEKTYYNRDVADLNRGTRGRDIYLVYKRESNKPALTRLSVYRAQSKCPSNYISVDKTISRVFNADLNGDSKGGSLFLCYQKEEKKFLELNKDWKELLQMIGISISDLELNSQFTNQINKDITKKYHEFNPNILNDNKKENQIFNNLDFNSLSVGQYKELITEGKKIKKHYK